MSRILPANEESIAEAARCLGAGGLVAFPTETVYGLGANALDPAAIELIYRAKQRPRSSPLIVHAADTAQARSCCSEWPAQAAALAAAFWPGPLTLVLLRNERIPEAITGGLPGVGLRVPAHPVARSLIEACGFPIAAPSANRFTRISPTRAEHVDASLGPDVAMVLDGGPCALGIESTVVRIEPEGVRMLRPGALPRRLIEAVLGAPLLEPPPGREREGASADASPGLHARHYAPRTPTFQLFEGQALPPGAGVALLRSPRPRMPSEVTVLMLAQSPREYAAELYARLHEADAGQHAWIAIEALPAVVDWEAVSDRVNRATTQA